MNRHDLRERLSRHPVLAPHRDWLLSIARPCVDIAITDAPPRPDGGGSRFGGEAFVPADFAWPVRDVGRYEFLGQIDFAEVPALPADAALSSSSPSLPTTGLLSLFFAHDDEGEVFWGDDGYVVGYLWDDTAWHVLRAAPAPAPEMDAEPDPEANAFTPPPARRLAFAPGLDLPRHAELRADWPFTGDDLSDGIDALDDALDADRDTAREYLLGYPTFATLAYDPTPGPEWVPLLDLSSRDELAWCWHDGDRLMVFIEAARLAARVFSQLKCDAG